LHVDHWGVEISFRFPNQRNQGGFHFGRGFPRKKPGLGGKGAEKGKEPRGEPQRPRFPNRFLTALNSPKGKGRGPVGWAQQGPKERPGPLENLGALELGNPGGAKGGQRGGPGGAKGFPPLGGKLGGSFGRACGFNSFGAKANLAPPRFQPPFFDNFFIWPGKKAPGGQNWGRPKRGPRVFFPRGPPGIWKGPKGVLFWAGGVYKRGGAGRGKNPLGPVKPRGGPLGFPKGKVGAEKPGPFWKPGEFSLGVSQFAPPPFGGRFNTPQGGFPRKQGRRRGPPGKGTFGGPFLGFGFPLGWGLTPSGGKKIFFGFTPL